MGYMQGMARPEKNHPLYHWRKINGNKTLEELAEEVGVTQSHLSEIENWNNVPSLDLVARLSALTGIDMKDFVKATESAQ
jgi:transcriptional regulator with XRE-family HTH domain